MAFTSFLNQCEKTIPLEKSYKNTEAVQKMQWQITAFGQINNLEKSVHKLKNDMLLKTKDTIFIKNEVRKSLVTNKNPSTKDIITHYVDKLKSEIKRVVDHKE